MPATSSAKAGAVPLRGVDRVAAILLTVGNPIAATLMKRFEPAEIKRITRAAAELKSVSPDQIRVLIEDFANEFASGASVVGDAADVERMLAGALPEDEIDEILGDLNGGTDIAIWDRMSEIAEGELAAYVANEHPQTAALILSKVKSSCAARVISRLPADRRDGIFRRMIAVKPIAQDAMDLFERILSEEFTLNFSANADADHHARIAEIINKLDQDQVEQVLGSLESTSPRVAKSLRSLMFQFEEVTSLSDAERSALFNRVSADDIVMALRGTEQAFRDTVLSAVSARVRKMMEQELSDGQSVPQRDVIEARKVITENVLALAAEGVIRLGDDEAAEEEIYVS